MGSDEHGWVIERADSEVSAPKYWAAGMRDPNTYSAWTSNHVQAIRFARALDAARVAERLMDGIEVRICEHIWTDTPHGVDHFSKRLHELLQGAAARINAAR